MWTTGKKLNNLFENCASCLVFIATLVAYWTTADHSASYWDCPEYITCASRLEIGHPPGNPVWMLAMRFATILFPSEYHALVINLWSGIFMALAAYFITRITYSFAIYVATKYSQKHYLPSLNPPFLALPASLAAGFCFGFCDSTWFSAVEAEVYAMSAFFTSLMIWLMVVWAKSYNHAKQRRLIILIAYLTGLSLGIHQLNLLCIPVLALMFVLRKYPFGKTVARGLGAIMLSFVSVVLILIGLMNGTLSLAQFFELAAVNSFSLPYFSGVYIYICLLTLTTIAAVIATTKGSRTAIVSTLSLFIMLSGILVFKGNIIIAAILSVVVAITVVFIFQWQRERIFTCIMSLALILLGYSSFALILIRGYAAPPMNEGAPTDIFALASYIARDQYGSSPLFYGSTPYSKPMVEERWIKGKKLPDYSRFILEKGKSKLMPVLPSPRLSYRSRMLTQEDSSENKKIIGRTGPGYLISDYTFTRVNTPELDMLFPRITSPAQNDLESYESWVGMNKETMEKVAISETYDSVGNPVPKIGISGKRDQQFSYIPTISQNLRYFLSYQLGYMYFRYLLWNFMGRQNDIPSTGEIDHGNFITGFKPIDDAMLGDNKLMPAYASSANPGRNVYYGIPFILGIIGIIFLFNAGKTGHQTLAVITLFFIMTGVAIVVYLNQLPGEPRERDYSFLGSYMAFAMWIGFGVMAIGMWLLRLKVRDDVAIGVSITSAFLCSLLLLIENMDDHDRTGRSEPFDYASNLLLTEQPAIIFTQGDNFTFPMWYAQEVRNTGRHHTVIDVSYFAIPEYVVNLMKQGDRGVSFTAKPADIAYGAYSYTRIPNDADTTVVPAIEALRQLYSSTDGEPVFRHNRVSIPGKTINDTLIIDLRKYANGSSILPFRKLMLLDLLATNAASESPRPVYFHSGIATDFYSPVIEATRRLPYVNSYYPLMPDSAYIGTVAKAIQYPLELPLRDSVLTLVEDPLIQDQKRRQRGEMIISTKILLDSGYVADAKYLAFLTEMLYPYNNLPAGSFTLADSTFHEGLEFARLKMVMANKTKERYLAQQASSSIEEMLKESRQWRDYYIDLPKWRRKTVSNSTRRFISIIPRLEAMKKECDSLILILPEPESDPSLKMRPR